jgi:hypothetical protein
MNMHSTRDFNGPLNGPIGDTLGAASGGASTVNGSAGAASDATDEARMDQIRELLHGEMKRQHEDRIAVLEARVRELESGIFNQLDALHVRLEALSGEMMNVRREHLDELARGFADMGDRVRRLTVRD